MEKKNLTEEEMKLRNEESWQAFLEQSEEEDAQDENQDENQDEENKKKEDESQEQSFVQTSTAKPDTIVNTPKFLVFKVKKQAPSNTFRVHKRPTT